MHKYAFYAPGTLLMVAGGGPRSERLGDSDPAGPGPTVTEPARGPARGRASHWHGGSRRRPCQCSLRPGPRALGVTISKVPGA